jgi:hypothetical protein
MESKMVDVMIHIDLDIGHQNRENLRDLILNHEGVDAAAYHDEKPHLMIVEYNPDQVSSQELLDIVKSQGVNAELVGL